MAGLIATKVGMSRLYRENGESVPVTFLKVDPNVVVRMKTKEKDGYNAVVLGIKPKMWRSRKGKEHIRYALQKEWQVDSLDGFEAGKELKADMFAVDAMVTVCGVSKGKGFQGVMRRHNFGGGPASHGSHFKREPGSIGMRAQPGRVLKGHPMAGHMGQDRVTVRNRAVVAVDMEQGVVAVKGPVPGPAGSRVYLTLESSPEAKK